LTINLHKPFLTFNNLQLKVNLKLQTNDATNRVRKGPKNKLEFFKAINRSKSGRDNNDDQEHETRQAVKAMCG